MAKAPEQVQIYQLTCVNNPLIIKIWSNYSYSIYGTGSYITWS